MEFEGYKHLKVVYYIICVLSAIGVISWCIYKYSLDDDDVTLVCDDSSGRSILQS